MKINTAFIQSLLDTGKEESTNLDYKRDFKIDKDFVPDVISFANTEGGFLIYGITEERSGNRKTGKPGEVVGVSTDRSLDDLTLQIQQTLYGNTSPSFADIRIHSVEYFGKFVLVLEIPKFHRGPIATDGRVFRRRLNSKYIVTDVTELQILFRDSKKEVEDIIEKAIQERYNNPNSLLNKANNEYNSTTNLIIHIVSESYNGKDIIELARIKTEENIKRLNPLGYHNGYNYKFCPEGFVTFTSHKISTFENRQVESYVLVDKYGLGELFTPMVSTIIKDGNIYLKEIERGQSKIIYGNYIWAESQRAIDAITTVLKQLEFNDPFQIRITLLNLKDTIFVPDNSLSGHRIKVNKIEIPLFKIGEISDSYRNMKLAFDTLYQYVGFPECPF